MAAIAALMSLSSAVASSSGQEPPSRPDDVLAIVAGRSITRAHVEDTWKAIDPGGFVSLEGKRTEILLRVLDEIIDNEVLAQEARRRGMTGDELLKVELPPRMPPITDDQVYREFDRLKGSAQDLSIDQMRPTIVEFLTERQPGDARRRYAAELRSKAGDSVNVLVRPLRHDVPISSTDPVRGPAAAPVTLVLFSDFECPFCRELEPALAQLQATYPQELRTVWKDFPMPGHPAARLAARAARCAGAQGDFWRYRDQLFKREGGLLEPDLYAYATKFGLNREAFGRCLDSSQYDDVIDGSIVQGKNLGVTGTPTMFINGRALAGAVPFAMLERMFLDELAAVRSDGAPLEPARVMVK